MGTVFRKTVTKAMPPSAEIIERKGQRHAKWIDSKGKSRTAPMTTGNDGKDRIVVETRNYYAKFRDGPGIVRTVATGCKDETAARSVLRDLERRAELVRSGVLSSAEDSAGQHRTSPIDPHFRAYFNSMHARGLSESHRRETERHLRRIAKECSFRTLADIGREPFERWLVGVVASGAGARTRNRYRDDLVTFLNWCIESGRMLANPIASINKLNEEADRRRQRRSLTEEELVRLLDVARRRPLEDARKVRRGKRRGESYAELKPETIARLEWLGRERSVLYKTKVLTGLRKNELASLTVGQVNLDDGIPYLALSASDAKNGENADIVLRADLAKDLGEWLTAKLEQLQAKAIADGSPIPARLPSETPLFNVPTGLLRIFDRDLKAAGISKRDERGRTLDVHALRTTFATMLSRAGVGPRTAQAALRHSDIRLTMQTYTDPKLLDIAGALKSLPAMPIGDERSAMSQSAKATGTDDLGQNPFAPRFAPTADRRGQNEAIPVKLADGTSNTRDDDGVDATSMPVNTNGPLTTSVNEPTEWSLRGSNPRPHGCDAEGDELQDYSNKQVTSSIESVCTPVCTGNPNSANDSVEAVAAALLGLSADDRAKLVALLLAGDAKPKG